MKKNRRQEQLIITCPTYQVSCLPDSQITRRTSPFVVKKGIQVDSLI